MSETQNLTPQQMAQVQANAQAFAQVLEKLLPQAFTSGEILNSPEGGGIDEWKLSKISGRVLLSLIYFRHRGKYDHVRVYGELADLMLRGSKSIDGLGLKMMENIAIGLAGGGGRRNLMKKPGVIGRYVTQRDWKEKAKRTNSQVIE